MARVFSGTQRCRCTDLTFIIIAFFTFFVYVVEGMNQPTMSSSTAQSATAENIAREEVHETHTFAALGEEIEELIEQYSAFAGRLFPILSKFFISRAKARQILAGIQAVARWDEWIIIILIGWATVPIIKYPYEYLSMRSSRGSSSSSTCDGTNSSIGLTKRGQEKSSSSSAVVTDGAEVDETYEPQNPQFEDTFISQLAYHISQAGKIAALVYSIDCAIIAIKEMGFVVKKEYTSLLPKFIYTSWMVFRVIEWKRYAVTKAVLSIKKGEWEGKKNRAMIANKMTDLIMIAIAIFLEIDVLNINAGVALKSFFAVGGAGTVLISFASKDLAIAVVSGLALQASDKMFEGDVVKFEDIIGHVDHIGLMETVITDDDEMVMAIPNKELFSSRIINMSRIKYSRVFQELRFHYEDSQKLPLILDEIIKEVRNTCSLVVTDGSKPLRANFKRFGMGYLEVDFEAILRCGPETLDYENGRQEVLLAIDRAVRRLNVQFAVVKEILYPFSTK